MRRMANTACREAPVAASGRCNLVAWSGVLRPAAGGSGGRHGEISAKARRGQRAFFISGPAPGFRDSGGRGSRAGGTLWLVGVGGCNWMSSIITTDGFYLYFDPGVIARNGSSHRAYGFPLRCLQEEGGAARHSKTGFCSAKPAGHTYPLVSRRQRKELRAPSSSSRRRGMAATRALLRSADSLLADQFPGARFEKLLRPTVIDRAPGRFILFRQKRNS